MRCNVRLLLFLLFIVTILCAACTKTLVVPLEPGKSALVDDDHGVVFGRVIVTSEEEDPLRSSAHLTSVGWQFLHEETGERFVAPKVTQNGWYVLNLPPGPYRITELRYFHGFTGEWEGRVPATFTVLRDECVYLGTWRIQLKTVGMKASAVAQVEDELAQLPADFQPMLRFCPTPARVRLMNSLRDGYLSLVQPSPGG